MPGKLDQIEAFPSEFLPPRQVDVWMPPGYTESDARYPVMYMMDGQNVFYDEHSLAGIGWGVIEAMEVGIASGEIPPAIIVGIWSGDNRFGEYMPYRPIYLTEQSEKDFWAWEADYQPMHHKVLVAEQFLDFLTLELKPYIDSHYRTRPERSATSIMGSSMGALISIYALCERPDVFGGAGCVSIHWIVGYGIMFPYMNGVLPTPGSHKIYYDYGTLGLDAEYEPHQTKIDGMMHAKGYTPDVDWMTRQYEGHTHSEKDWRKRVHIPLGFLLHD